MSEQDAEHMLPGASPGTVAKAAGVRRVNNMPVYIIGGLMGVFLLVMVLVATDRVAKQNQTGQDKADKPNKTENSGNSSVVAKQIAGARTEGIIAPKAASAPVAIARPSGNWDAPPPPPNVDAPPTLTPAVGGNSAAPQSAADSEQTRIRNLKLQEFEQAVKAKTAIAGVPHSTAIARTPNAAPGGQSERVARPSNRDDASASYQSQLAQLQAARARAGGAATGSTGAPQLLQTAASNNNIAQFGTSGQGDRWRLESRMEAPHSPFELRAGFVVPAMLISGINSELPGQIIGQVAQNVYDTPTGKYLLIPQGSRLVGAYSSAVAYGQARVLVAWQRIIFPDGKAMDIGAMPGSDSAGYAGLTDQVNNHYFRLFSSAFLMSAVTAGIAMSQPQQTPGYSTTPNASSAMSEALGQQLGQVTAQLIAKNMNIAPTLEIRPGYRFNVMVTKDMTFSKPYQSFDY